MSILYRSIISFTLACQITYVLSVGNDKNTTFKIPQLKKLFKKDNQKIEKKRKKSFFNRISGNFKPLFRGNSWSSTLFTSEKDPDNNIQKTRSEVKILYSRKLWFQLVNTNNHTNLISSIYQVLKDDKYTSCYFSFILKNLPEIEKTLLNQLCPQFFKTAKTETELKNSLQQIIKAGLPIPDKVNKSPYPYLTKLQKLFEQDSTYYNALYSICEHDSSLIIYLFCGYCDLLEKEGTLALSKLKNEIDGEFNLLRKRLLL